MRCHYEVLEVARDADIEELKKQYKKLALRWHPDKNVGNMDEATERFKELIAAYTCLSNPNERKWYDDHRQAILKGEQEDDEDEEEDINIWPYFDSSCYSGEPDSENGFFTVYNELFTRLDEKEKEYASYNAKNKRAGKNDREVRPMFGTSQSSDAEVNDFYRYWRDFSSCLSFAELDKYDTNEEGIPRNIRRAMERENNKNRLTGRKEYVESIRQLVEFIKKLDTRALRMEKEARDRRRREKIALEVKRAQEAASKQEERERNKEKFMKNPEEILRSEEERRRAFLLDNDYDDIEFFSYTSNEPLDTTTTSELVMENMCKRGNAGTGSNSGVSSGAGIKAISLIDDDGNQIFRCDLCDKNYTTEKQLIQHNGNRYHHMKDKERRQQSKSRKVGGDAKTKKVDIASVINSVINGNNADSSSASPVNDASEKVTLASAEGFVSRRGTGKQKKKVKTVAKNMFDVNPDDDKEEEEEFEAPAPVATASVFQLAVDEEAEDIEEE